MPRSPALPSRIAHNPQQQLPVTIAVLGDKETLATFLVFQNLDLWGQLLAVFNSVQLPIKDKSQITCCQLLKRFFTSDPPFKHYHVYYDPS